MLSALALASTSTSTLVLVLVRLIFTFLILQITKSPNYQIIKLFRVFLYHLYNCILAHLTKLHMSCEHNTVNLRAV
jgi:hypothetical protein